MAKGFNDSVALELRVAQTDGPGEMSACGEMYFWGQDYKSGDFLQVRFVGNDARVQRLSRFGSVPVGDAFTMSAAAFGPIAFGGAPGAAPSGSGAGLQFMMLQQMQQMQMQQGVGSSVSTPLNRAGRTFVGNGWMLNIGATGMDARLSVAVPAMVGG